MRRLTGVLGIVLAVRCGAAAAETPNPDEECRANLRAIAAGLKAYLVRHKAKLPTGLRQLYADGYIMDLSVLACPASGTKIAGEAEIDAKTSYALTKTLEGQRPVLLIRGKAGYHGGKALAFFSDFSIREVAAPAPPVVARPPATPPERPRPPVAPDPPVVPPDPPRPPVTPPDPPIVPPPPKPPVETAEALHQQAVAHLSHGRLPEAEGLLRRALSKAPGSATYANDLGNVQFQLKKFDAAAASYALAARLGPNQPVYHRNHAGALVQLGKWHEAVSPCAAAVRLAPKNAALRNDLGNIYYHLRRWHEASMSYYTAVQADPRNGLYHANYAGTLLLLGRRADAERVARGAISLGHRNHWVYKQLGLMR